MTASSVDFDGTGTVAYSETDSSNSGASPGNFPDSTAPSNVKLIGRAHMGAGQRWYDRDHAVSGGTVGGTGNAITLAYTVAPNAYAQGQRFCFKATAANSGATTLNVNSLGAKNVFKRGTSGVVACTGGEIESGDIVICDYDGTQMQLISQAANAAAAVGVSSIADATNGGLNFSASTGAVSAKLQPSDLATKSSPTTSDSVVIMDAAASNVAKTALVSAICPFTKSFVSSQQTITSAGTLTIAHGLGVAPALVFGELVNQTPELGYTAGQTISIALIPNMSQTTNDGIAVRKDDATNLLVKYGSSTNVFTITNFSAGTAVPITPANWKLVLRAYA